MLVENKVQKLMAMSEVPTDAMIKEIDKNYLSMLVADNPSLGEKDFIEFISKCRLTGADPRLNQIYLIVHNSWNSQKRVSEPKGTTIFSYQFFLRLAQKTGELDGLHVETNSDTYMDFNNCKTRPSITTTCVIKRRGMAESIVYKARLWEFAKTDKEGKLSGNWKNSTYMMLEKCAVANALRWAFPETLGNMYIGEEMEKVTAEKPQTIKVEAEVNKIEAPKQQEPELVQEQEDTEALEAKRSEILDFLNTRNSGWFEIIGRKKEQMLEVVNTTQTVDGMNSIYDRCLKYDQLVEKSKSDGL